MWPTEVAFQDRNTGCFSSDSLGEVVRRAIHFEVGVVRIFNPFIWM